MFIVQGLISLSWNKHCLLSIVKSLAFVVFKKSNSHYKIVTYATNTVYMWISLLHNEIICTYCVPEKKFLVLYILAHLILLKYLCEVDANIIIFRCKTEVLLLYKATVLEKSELRLEHRESALWVTCHNKLPLQLRIRLIYSCKSFVL